MQLNAEDGGKRKFIMVQLPEATDENSEAYKTGYKNICEIGKERIRRAGEKILVKTLDKFENINIIYNSTTAQQHNSTLWTLVFGSSNSTAAT
jgi:adenine-specific DNA-methyltransferase